MSFSARCGSHFGWSSAESVALSLFVFGTGFFAEGVAGGASAGFSGAAGSCPASCAHNSAAPAIITTAAKINARIHHLVLIQSPSSVGAQHAAPQLAQSSTKHRLGFFLLLSTFDCQLLPLQSPISLTQIFRYLTG